MGLTLRYMRIEDVPGVVKIDQIAFLMPWSAHSYAYEVGESTYSYMLVLENRPESHEKQQPHGWRRWLNRLNGHSNGLMIRGQLVGYGGLWNITDEAHISTIATHPDLRGQGYGELLLAAMVRRSITLKSSYIVLEVRVSNSVAKNLYEKYEFKTFDVKRNYYRSDGEDAYDMRLDLKEEGILERFYERYAVLQSRFAFDDRYTDTAPPRVRKWPGWKVDF